MNRKLIILSGLAIALAVAFFFTPIRAISRSYQPVETKQLVQKPDALIMPFSGIYKVINDKMIKVGEVKDSYYYCNVLKKITMDTDEYCLIQINQDGAAPDICLVKKSSVILLDR